MKTIKQLFVMVSEVFFEVFVAMASVNAIGSHPKRRTKN